MNFGTVTGAGTGNPPYPAFVLGYELLKNRMEVTCLPTLSVCSNKFYFLYSTLIRFVVLCGPTPFRILLRIRNFFNVRLPKPPPTVLIHLSNTSTLIPLEILMRTKLVSTLFLHFVAELPLVFVCWHHI